MIYLDNAATSLLKPPAVAAAVRRAMGTCATPGRGVHAPAMAAAAVTLACREEAAALFHMDRPENVVFTMNATHGLNIAIRSLFKPGSRVVVSGYEHNAVMRPLYALGISPEVAAAPLFDPEQMVQSFARRLRGADGAVCTQISNVYGYVLPLKEIAALCRREGVPLIVDAAQGAGVLDFDFPVSGAAFCAMPGHKGLMGPQGTGLLLCRESAAPLLYGGTGGESESRTMPDALPDRLEAGTQNISGIAGLTEGLRAVRAVGPERIRSREIALCRELVRGLEGLPGLRVIVPEDGPMCGVVSVVPERISCEELAEALGRAGIAVRAGLHCAPLAHRTGGTLSTGTVRFSLSARNTRREIQTAAAAVEKILKFGYKM